jgi:uncharacterized protein YndB with AHSA1/START domain
MPKVTVTAELPASPEKVWETVTDLKRYEEWLELHLGWKDEPPAQLTAGTTFPEKITLMNMPNTITWTVVAYDPPSRLEMSGTGMAGVQVTMTTEVKPVEAGSQVALSAEFAGQLIVGALGEAIAKQGEAAVQRSLEKLATLFS